MNSISATELARTPGVVIDQVLREGAVIVTRYNKQVAVLRRDEPDGPQPERRIGMQEFLADLTLILDFVEGGHLSYTLTRNGRPVAWLLPMEEGQ